MDFIGGAEHDMGMDFTDGDGQWDLDTEATPLSAFSLASTALGADIPPPPPAGEGKQLKDFVDAHVTPKSGSLVTKKDLLESFVAWRQSAAFADIMQLHERDRAELDAKTVMPVAKWKDLHRIDDSRAFRNVWVDTHLDWKLKRPSEPELIPVPKPRVTSDSGSNSFLPGLMKDVEGLEKRVDSLQKTCDNILAAITKQQTPSGFLSTADGVDTPNKASAARYDDQKHGDTHDPW